MTRRISLASAALMVFAALLALVLATTPAIAHHKSDHSKGKTASSGASDHDGDADSDSNTAYTEDNDTNDGGTKNNVSDDGDNKHPSGKDRSVENGKSGNQGNSESDPDGDENGGPDKPNGTGGDDLADQDGNNGCGNDDDFEDDNNGNCGKDKDEQVKPAAVPSPTPSTTPTSSTTPSPCPSPMTYPASSGTCGTTTTSTPGPNEVLGDEPVESKDCPIETMAADEKECEAVLGEIIGNGEDSPSDDVAAGGVAPNGAAAERPALGAAMPFTGANIVLILVLALGLLGAGAALLHARRS